MENNVEENVTDFLYEILYENGEPPAKRVKNVIGQKKISKIIHVAPLDNVSFKSEESVTKWKFIFHRSITSKREIKYEVK